MITNFLLEHAALVPVAILVIAAVCAAIGWAARTSPRILWALTILALLPVFALTLMPTNNRVDQATCTLQFDAPTLGSVELLANVALFLPPVLFAALASRRPLTTLAAGTALSVVIEASQALVPAIGRACDTNDWLMHTIGAVVGVALAYLVSRPPRPSRTSASRPSSTA